MYNRSSSSAKRIALSGILLALTLIALFFATIMPINELSLYVLCSFFVSIVVIEHGIKGGWIFYITSCLLSLIIPNKLGIVPYVVFFGMYGLIKYHIESLDKIILEYVLKLAFFNLFIAVAVAFLKELLLSNFARYPLWVVIAGLEAAFLVYDYTYSLFIGYYKHKLKIILKIW